MTSPLAKVRGLVGLATLGEGLFILFRVVPHEAPLLGAVLSIVGAALLWRAELPRVERLPVPRMLAALAGALAAAGVLVYDAARGALLDAPKIAIVALGALTAIAALAPARARVRGVPVATLLLWSVPLAWAPLAVWAAQGAAKTALGGTPLELFVRVGLLAPMALVLSILGRSPHVSGQVITYATPRGPLALEVGVACSGLQAMAMFAGILAVYLVAARPPPRQAAFWCAVGLLGVYAINVARLVVLSLVGSAWGVDALERAHAQAGWIFFVLWTAVFAWLAIGRQPARAAAS